MKKSEDNNVPQIKEDNTNHGLDEFNFILNRSENIDKIKNINNHVKKIDYSFSSEENYSDEILYYLTQVIDRINQCRYNNSLNNLNSNNNFKIYNTNYINNIDAYYQYELIKREIHFNKKAFNVHEHRKIPYEEQNRLFYRRRFNNNFNGSQFQRNDYNNRRNISVDTHNTVKDEGRNRDKVRVGGIPEFTNDDIDNNNYFKRFNNEYKEDTNRSFDNIKFKKNFGNQKKRNFDSY